MKTIHMQLKKDTKNTYVYAEIDRHGIALEDFEASIPTLYIRKQVFGRTPPQQITLTFKPGIDAPDEFDAAAAGGGEL